MGRPTAVILWSVVCPVVLIAGGCGTGLWPSREGNGQAASNAGPADRLSGVAIVDLDEVAKQLGSDAALLKAINDGQASLNQQLRSFQSTAGEVPAEGAGWEAHAGGRGIGARTSQTEVGPFAAGTRSAVERSAADGAQNELSTYRQKLIQHFRQEVVPAAQEAASPAGTGVVLTRTSACCWPSMMPTISRPPWWPSCGPAGRLARGGRRGDGRRESFPPPAEPRFAKDR